MIRRLSRRQWIVDASIAVGVFLLGILPAISYSPVEPFALLGFSTALVVRRGATLVALGIAWLTALGELAVRVEPVGPSNILIVVILYACGAHSERVVRWVGFASAFLGAACITLYLNVLPLVTGERSLGLGESFATAFTFAAALAGFLLAWTLGVTVRAITRSRTSQAEALRAERVVVQEQERVRIARDMHDVVAHSLAVVIAQADGARYLRAEDPEAVDEALRTIASTAREALTDVRVLLAQLRHDEGTAPQPTLGDLDRLYEQFRASGLVVQVEAEGMPAAIPTSVQLAVFRIVQESLTNALRHGAPDRPVTVRFDWVPGGLHLAVASGLRTDGRDTATGTHPVVGTGGHGLAGMTERAALVGGHLAAAPDGDRFVVRAWLPAGLPAGTTAAMPAPPTTPPVVLERSS